MKFSKQSKTSLQSFIITFFSSLLIFALVAWLVFGAINKQFVDDEKNPSENKEESTTPVSGDVSELPESSDPDDELEGDSFTVLVAGYNITGDSLDAMVIVDVNKESKALTLYPVNPDAKVYVGYGTGGSVNVRLGDLCRYKDMAYITDKVTALTSVQIDYYLSLTAKGFIEAVDALNKKSIYSYTVPKDMVHEYSKDPELEEYNIDFKRGDKLTSGIDIYNVLRYAGDSDSDRMSRQINVARDVIKSLITSQIKAKSVSSVVSMLEALLVTMKECKTNISIETFITESFELISAIPDFSFETSTKFKTATLNFK